VSGFFIKADRRALAAPVTATIYEGRVARTHAPGDALVYSTGPEHRDATELINIVDQLAGLPVYLGHPTIFPASKSGEKVVGVVETGRLDDDTAVGRISITDDEALAAVNAGTHELSLGYQCALDGDRYQRNIKLDHLAIVERARCGTTCSMRTDMEEPVKTEEIKLGTIEVKVDTSAAIAEIQKIMDTLGKLDAMMPKEHAKSCPAYTDSSATCDCNMGKKPMMDCGCQHGDDKLNAKSRNALETEEFAVPESRKLPIPDEGHVRAAMSRFGQTEFASSAEKRSAFHKIVAKAHKLGIETSGFEKEWSGRLDDESGTCTCNNRAMNHNIGETMSQENKDEMAALQARITELEVEATNAKNDAKAAQAALETAKSELAQVKADAEASLAQAKTDAADAFAKEVDARVATRVGLLTEAARFDLKDAEGNKLDLAKLNDREIKCAVIKHVDGDEVPAEKSADYVDGVYRGSLKRGNDAAGSRADARQTINQMRNDGAANVQLTYRQREEAARDAMKRESSLAWTKTTENA
jgi:hypothetical protein